MKKDFHLTQTGVDKLQAELDDLRMQRGKVAERLRIARDFGDLSENMEYHNAREEQVKVETRIKEIKNILKSVDIIKEGKHTSVELGSTVTLKEEDHEITYTIVGSFEADPLKNKISDESPIGKALTGKKVGEEVEITLPAGVKTYTVEKIK